MMYRYKVLLIGDNPDFLDNIAYDVNEHAYFCCAGTFLFGDLASVQALNVIPDVAVILSSSPSPQIENDVDFLKSLFPDISVVFFSPVLSTLVESEGISKCNVIATGTMCRRFQDIILRKAIETTPFKSSFEDTANYLKDYGFETSSSGFINIVKIISLAERNPFYTSLKELYVQAARELQTTTNYIEVSARAALTKTFHTFPKRFNEIGFTETPPTAEFINRILRERRGTRI